MATRNTSARVWAEPVGDHSPLDTAGVGQNHGAAWAFPLAFGALVFAAVLALGGRVLTSDSFLDLVAGRLIVADRSVPTANHLTAVAAGGRWIDQQWLANVAFYAVWDAFGAAAVGVLSALLIASGFVLFARLMLSRGVAVGRASIWLTVAFFVCQPNTATRAQSFAYPLFVILLGLALRMERLRRPDVRVWAAVPLLILWANLHGSAVTAAALFALCAVVHAAICVHRRLPSDAVRFALLALASSTAVFVTPYSPADLVAYYRSVMSNPLLGQYIVEWNWSSPTDLGNCLFYALLVAVAVIAVLAVRRKLVLSPTLVGATALLGIGAVHAVRVQTWFAFPAALLAVELLTRLMPEPQPQESDSSRAGRIAWAGVAVIVLAALVIGIDSNVRLVYWLIFVGGIVAFAVPSGRMVRRALAVSLVLLVCVSVAVQMRQSEARMSSGISPQVTAAITHYAAQHPSSRILADADTATQLLWRDPRLRGRVGYDASLEIYPHAALQRYLEFWQQNGAHPMLAARGYDILVASNASPQLYAKLGHLSGWHVLARDAGEIAVTRAG